MDEQITKLFKSNRIFAELPEEASSKLLSITTEVNLQPGEVLFYQGDPSESLYLLLSGKLSAQLMGGAGDTRLIGHIDVGETVGELGAISNEPRSLTITAITPAHLLKIPAKAFVECCHRYPALMFATLHPIIMRSKNMLEAESLKRRTRHIVIIAAQREISLAEFSKQLLQHAGSFPSLLSVSDYQPEFSNLDATMEEVDAIINHMAVSKKVGYKTLYILKNCNTPLAKIALRKAEKLYMMADNLAEPRIDHDLLSKIQRKHNRLRTTPNFVMLHPADAVAPKNTAAWLQLTHFNMYHHVRMNNARDFLRLLRFIRGKAVGLVLSGGGTRGWAHLGAIKALRAAKIPIDMIGGTSVGAAVAACYAVDMSYENSYGRFYKIVVNSKRSVSWRSLTLPIISIFSGKNFTNSLSDVFKNKQIEDFWLPFFCVSCNLTTNKEAVHMQGTAWERTRASMSIPGIIPPMLLNGEIHYDGGLLNNLPVDVMRQYLGSKSKIIAVELNSFAPQVQKYSFPPILTFKEALWAFLGIGEKKYKFPSFVETFLRGLFVGSLAKSKQNSLAANVFVSLELGKYRLLQSNPEQADNLIALGFAEALKQIYQAPAVSSDLSSQRKPDSNPKGIDPHNRSCK